MTTQTITATPGANVEELPSPLVLAGQIADLTRTLATSLAVGGDWGGDYGTLLDRLADVSSSLSDCSAQISADTDGKPRVWVDVHKATSLAEGIYGDACHTLRVASDLIANHAE